MKRIAIAGPWITEREIAYVTRAVAEGWYEEAGTFQREFEADFAKRIGRRHAIALPSCTSALHLILAAHGIGPGDEVIVPELTWIATAAPISYVGAVPVFADVDAATWCLTADTFARCITGHTKAVIAVDLYGNLPDYDAICRIADQRGIAVIEDAAQAIGACYRGRPAGSFGLASAFSFHGSKTLTTGEGGMLLTDHEALYRRALVLRDHGRPPEDRAFLNTDVAFKYRMSAMQAALGQAQLERLDELVAKKRAIFSAYAKELATIPGLTWNCPGPEVAASYWMVTVILSDACGLDKGELSERLAADGIDTRPFFHPLSSLPAYRGHPGFAMARDRNPIAYRVAPYGINLPSALRTSEADVVFVCERLRHHLRKTANDRPESAASC